MGEKAMAPLQKRPTVVTQVFCLAALVPLILAGIAGCDEDRPGQPAGPGSVHEPIEEQTVVPVSRRASLPPTEEVACGRHQLEVEKLMVHLPRDCGSSEDCSVIDFGCPFGCGTSLSKSARGGAVAAQVRAAVATYRERCLQCEYRCRRPVPACVKNRCVAQ